MDWSDGGQHWIGDSSGASAKGKHKNLKVLFDKVNEDHFCGGVVASVSWSRKEDELNDLLTDGWYSKRHCAIVVNRCLDKKIVPDYVIEQILYHEMLHAVLVPLINKKVPHSETFYRLEALFPDHDRAVNWLEIDQAKTFGSVIKRNKKELAAEFLRQLTLDAVFRDFDPREMLRASFTLKSKMWLKKGFKNPFRVVGWVPNAPVLVIKDARQRFYFLDAINLKHLEAQLAKDTAPWATSILNKYHLANPGVPGCGYRVS